MSPPMHTHLDRLAADQAREKSGERITELEQRIAAAVNFLRGIEWQVEDDGLSWVCPAGCSCKLLVSHPTKRAHDPHCEFIALLEKLEAK